ncbi:MULTISPECIES: hypothetical protein [Paracoccus]|uniref:Uncharacterized protein n=1 Tax=Paracoccus shanxieyensis TaxID=2675752 RepID=A0A6L6IXN1_9RHOB|nr:hypothetical protein [Paracoccus shanxieyensis]MTH63354.1 hypothetical protein [Paracoccus shanxieyensis]MTH86275.1 hypothetical protein [Paracoccus shanxieyensis]
MFTGLDRLKADRLVIDLMNPDSKLTQSKCHEVDQSLAVGHIALRPKLLRQGSNLFRPGRRQQKSLPFGLASHLGQPVRQLDELAPVMRHRIRPTEPAIDRIQIMMPELLLDLHRWMRVVRRDGGRCAPDCPGHQDIDLQPTGMRVRADQRMQPCGGWDAAISALEEQVEGLADLAT